MCIGTEAELWRDTKQTLQELQDMWEACRHEAIKVLQTVLLGSPYTRRCTRIEREMGEACTRTMHELQDLWKEG